MERNFPTLIKQIIYYVNEYSTEDEPKIVEEQVIAKLKEKGLTDETARQCYKELEILDNLKLRSQKLNSRALKWIQKNEINQAKQKAILAAHYMRLRKYYPNGEFDKYLRQLNIQEMGNELISISVQKPGSSLASNTNLMGPLPQNASLPKQLKYLEDLKFSFPHTDYQYLPKSKIKNYGSQVSFEKMMEAHLRRLQDSLTKTFHSNLPLETRMQLYAKQLHENAEKAERIISESEKHEHKEKAGQKLDQFYRWVEEDEKKRQDPQWCFQQFVNKIREGKMK